MKRIDWTRSGMWSDAAFICDQASSAADALADRVADVSDALFALANRCEARAETVREARSAARATE